MPIPKVKSGQTEQEYVSECISAIFDEYGQEKASAICYSTYRKGVGMSTRGKISSYLREEAYKGISLIHLDAPCWADYEQVGTKILDGREVPNCVPKKKSNA